MSPESFLRKSTTRAANSAAGFLSQYREWLMTGDLAPITTPIFKKLDMGELLPTPCLKEIQQAVLGHIVAVAQKQVEQTHTSNADKPTKNWIVRILDCEGKVCKIEREDGEIVDLVNEFNRAGDCDRWAIRKLANDAKSDWYATVEHATLNVKTVITYEDALAQMLKQPKGPVCRTRGKSVKSLKWQPKAKQSRVSFSRG